MFEGLIGSLAGATSNGKELEQVSVDYLKKKGDRAQPLLCLFQSTGCLGEAREKLLTPESRSCESGANAHYRKPESQTEVDLPLKEEKKFNFPTE